MSDREQVQRSRLAKQLEGRPRAPFDPADYGAPALREDDMITIESLDYALRLDGLCLIVIAREDAGEQLSAAIRKYMGNCEPWESIEKMRYRGARIVVADVEKSFALTYNMTIHML